MFAIWGEGNVIVADHYLTLYIQVTLQQQLKTHAPGLKVKTVPQQFESIHVVDVYLPAVEGKERLIRRYAQSDKERCYCHRD